MSRSFFASLLALLLFVPTLCAQEKISRSINYPVEKLDAVDPAFLKLTNNNLIIRKDSILNEELLDLVRVKEADSILPSKSQRHRSGFGWLLGPFGIKWKAVTRNRTKYVGTANKDIGNPDKAEYTEYDININAYPHTQKYMDVLWPAYAKQKAINKKKLRGKDPNQPPFIPMTLETAHLYRLHCELTPPKDYREQITSLFYPVTGHKGFSGHPNFGEPTPTLGFYGAMVLDCNHNCHPEMHPYEWLWWLDVNPAKDSIANEKRWMVGLFRESSNRFRKWSKRPRVGLVSVPFLFSMDDPNPTIQIDHLVHSEFEAKGLKTLPELLPGALDLNFTEMKVALTGDLNPEMTLSIYTNKAIDTEGLRLWLSDVKTDGNWLKGYVNIAVSVTDIYTARVTVK